MASALHRAVATKFGDAAAIDAVAQLVITCAVGPALTHSSLHKKLGMQPLQSLLLLSHAAMDELHEYYSPFALLQGLVMIETGETGCNRRSELGLSMLLRARTVLQYVASGAELGSSRPDLAGAEFAIKQFRGACSNLCEGLLHEPAGQSQGLVSHDGRSQRVESLAWEWCAGGSGEWALLDMVSTRKLNRAKASQKTTVQLSIDRCEFEVDLVRMTHTRLQEGKRTPEVHAVRNSAATFVWEGETKLTGRFHFDSETAQQLEESYLSTQQAVVFPAKWIAAVYRADVSKMTMEPSSDSGRLASSSNKGRLHRVLLCRWLVPEPLALEEDFHRVHSFIRSGMSLGMERPGRDAEPDESDGVRDGSAAQAPDQLGVSLEPVVTLFSKELAGPKVLLYQNERRPAVMMPFSGSCLLFSDRAGWTTFSDQRRCTQEQVRLPTGPKLEMVLRVASGSDEELADGLRGMGVRRAFRRCKAGVACVRWPYESSAPTAVGPLHGPV